MSTGVRLITRIALFSALVYVFSWATSYLPNVSLAFFIVFTTGFLWGKLPGLLVGIIGMGLFTVFNPYGPAHPYMMVAQVLGMSGSGIAGSVYRHTSWQSSGKLALFTGLIGFSFFCTLFFYIPVNLVDAWLFGPFWPRFITGWTWSIISIAANAMIFPLLFGVTRHLYDRESRLV